MGLGGEATTSRFKTPSVSGGLIGSLRKDPEAVLESCRISESGPALAGPDPTPPESTTCFARPLHGHDSYLAHVGIRDVSMWSELVTIPFSVIRYLYRDPVLNTFSSVESAPETHLCIGSIPIQFFIQSYIYNSVYKSVSLYMVFDVKKQ